MYLWHLQIRTTTTTTIRHNNNNNNISCLSTTTWPFEYGTLGTYQYYLPHLKAPLSSINSWFLHRSFSSCNHVTMKFDIQKYLLFTRKVFITRCCRVTHNGYETRSTLTYLSSKGDWLPLLALFCFDSVYRADKHSTKIINNCTYRIRSFVEISRRMVKILST